MGEALIAGATGEGADGVEVRALSPLEATTEDVRRCEAIVLGTPENFGYMSGAMKFFFDTVYDELLEDTQGLPWALFVKAGNDGTGAVSAVSRIVTGLRWREVQEPIVVRGELRPEDLERCRELGAALAAGLSLGIY